MLVKEALSDKESTLKNAGLQTAKLDALVLLSFVLKKPKEWIYLNDDLKLKGLSLKKYKELINRRKKHEPVAYLTKNREFYGLDFYVDKRVLIPRPETELLVEQVLQAVNKKQETKNKRKTTIADIGTGSGCIAISVAKNLKNCKIYASDISKRALEVAKVNARKHKVVSKIKFLKGNILRPFKQNFDIILSNPPYVSRDEKVSAEVKFEPQVALYLKENFFEKLILEISQKLKPKGVAFLEIGKGQKTTIKNIVKRIMPASKIEFLKDYSGIDRVVKISNNNLV